jgi:metallophosphoesterase (TIGR00282 family)
MLRPANYPVGTAGAGFIHIEKNNRNWLVINLQGRDLMSAIDCPFRCFDSIVSAPCGSSIVLVDFHAESTREKEALAYYADGRASLFAGTHTHVQTADERILPNGCAYITDLGMTGISDSVIGMDPKICFDRMRKQVMFRMETAGNSLAATSAAATARIQGVVVEIDADTGKAVSVFRV